MASTLRELDYAIVQQCMHCGLCLPTCPTYDATKRERSSPRGRIALMRAVADGTHEITQTFADEMSFCLGCLACQSACPAGVNYAELLETARADIESARANSGWSRRIWRALFLGQVFMRPQALRFLGRALRAFQRVGLDVLFHRIGITQLLPQNLRRLERQTPRMAPAFSNELIQSREYPAGRQRYRVALLTGCIQDLVFSGVNRDTADVLLANGCVVDTPALQPCCGSLHAHNGEPRLAAQLARRLLDLIRPEDYDAIITNAGGCGSHLRHYGQLLANDPDYSTSAYAWDRTVRDIHEWLLDIDCRAPRASPFATPVTVTYHDSCHLAHGQRVTSQPRKLLQLLPETTFAELQEASWCCGSAGIYNITQPEQADLLSQRKIDQIVSTGADVVATANPGCHLQIVTGLRRVGFPTRVYHPVSLLAAAYRRESCSG